MWRAAADMKPADISAATANSITWPEIPFAYLIAAMLALGAVFFAGLRLSTMSRDAKLLADMKRDSARWIYRTAV